jgi:hypothetical protein
MNDNVDLSVRQFTGAWKVMCTGGSGHTVIESDGVQYIFSGVPIPFFNVALLSSRTISSDALMSGAKRACTWASSHGVPWLFVLTHETLDTGVDAAAVLDRCGLAAMMPLTGMLAPRVNNAAAAPKDLELTVPDTDAACSAILDINARAYGMDLEAGKQLIGTRSFWRGHFPVLGLVRAKPVCTAAVLMVDGYRYVALVATDPDQQRRGYAESTMRTALELSARVHGERPTVLHASEAGRPIYERMGYTTISTHTIFMDKRFLEGH